MSVTHADDGYFPRGSMLRRVQGERSVGLLYGQRALAIGALNSLTYVGTATHSRYRTEPFKRLAATGKMFETIFFGSREQADKVLAVVRTMHERVEGELGEDSGGYAPGTPYRAHDAELMLWTIAVAAESSAYFYELLVRPLRTRELDAFWSDWVRFGELFGMAPEVAPADWAAFRDYFDGFLASEHVGLTEEARQVGLGVAFHIPTSPLVAPAMELHNLIMLGSLPTRVRRHYGLSWNPAQQAAFLLATRGLRASRPLSPRIIARGRNAGRFEDVAKAEATLIKAGNPPIAIDPDAARVLA